MASTSIDVRFANLLAEIGAPLFAIAAVTSHFGVGVGATSTIWAAVIAATVVKTLQHFVVNRQLAAWKLGTTDVRRYVAMGAVNACVGAACALLTLPS